jgi:predicted RNA-binding protein associated with RNAse of E/G family
MPAAGVSRPTVVADRTVLEPGSPVVWFTFPGRHHDIGRFHTVDGRFTGYYANILTPVEMASDVWLTTDLFLDVFVDLDGDVHVLDRDELADAVAEGWLDRATARTAELEANRLVEAARAGEWPPAVVDAWPLERVREAAAGRG